MANRHQRWVKICPKCRSMEVELRIIGSDAGAGWVCLSCGFHSKLFPEVDSRGAKKLPYRPVNFIQSRMPMAEKMEHWYVIGFVLLFLSVFILAIIAMLE